MTARVRLLSRNLPAFLSSLLAAGLSGLAIALVSCNGTASINSMNGTATIKVTLTEPSSCAFPDGRL